MTLTNLPIIDFNQRIIQNNIDSKLLDKVLKDNNAIIAGGSVLASVIDGVINDLDIYVNLKNAQKFYNNLYTTSLIDSEYSRHIAPPYDKSFLIKNNILSRFTTYMRSTKVDIMVVSDDVSVESVVENFDLSFCKIWYNGTDILTRYYQDIINRKGTLGKDYLEAYLEGNMFTIKRLKKYNKRGFTITLPNIDTGKIEITRFSKNVISPEMWVVYKLLEILISMGGGTSYRDEIYFSFTVICLEKLHQYKTENRKDTLYTIDGLKYLMGILYEDKLTHFWTIDMLIYVMLCFESCRINGSYVSSEMLCDWLSPKYYDYFESIGIQLREKNDQPAHGFDDLDIPLCDGQVPPFSAGKNGFPCDATKESLTRRVREGLEILRLNIDILKNLYYTTYPLLKPLTHAERVAVHMAQVAANRRLANESSEEEDEEVEEETYDIPNSDQQVPGRCFSIMDAENINTSSWYPEDGSILFMIEFYPGAEADLVCTNTQVLQNAMNNETGINYKCASRRGFIAGTQTEISLDDDLPEGVGVDVTMTDIDYSVEYIPFSYGIDGTTSMNGYLPREQVQFMLDTVETGRQIRLFTLEFSDTVSHTVSKNNTMRGTEGADFVSTNHCQAGSAIIVFRVKEFTINQDRSPPPLQRQRNVETSNRFERMQRAVRRLWAGGDSPPPNPFQDDPNDGGAPRRLFGEDPNDEPSIAYTPSSPNYSPPGNDDPDDDPNEGGAPRRLFGDDPDDDPNEGGAPRRLFGDDPDDDPNEGGTRRRLFDGDEINEISPDDE